MKIPCDLPKWSQLDIVVKAGVPNPFRIRLCKCRASPHMHPIPLGRQLHSCKRRVLALVHVAPLVKATGAFTHVHSFTCTRGRHLHSQLHMCECQVLALTHKTPFVQAAGARTHMSHKWSCAQLQVHTCHSHRTILLPLPRCTGPSSWKGWGPLG